MPQWWLSRDETASAEGWSTFRLLNARAQGNLIAAELEGVSDRNAAEALKGFYVGAPREALPDPGEDEYYWSDLTGLKVENEQGEPLGVVAGLMSTGAHDVLQVVDGEVERLIPFVKAYALEVDLAGRKIRVDWQKDW